MEDHSLIGYLRRQSTVELKNILHYCLLPENLKNYAESLALICKVLEERSEELKILPSGPLQEKTL